MVHDHIESDKKPINWHKLALTLSVICIVVIGLISVAKRLKETQKRELYIESQHSELK